MGGGLVVCSIAWSMLNEPEAPNTLKNDAARELTATDLSKRAFYPLTMPLTTGPGTISVAISLGANRPGGFGGQSLFFFAETLLAVTLLCLLVYLFYRNSARLAQLIGATGTAIVVRLSAFLLFAIGIQVLWNGLAELLREIR